MELVIPTRQPFSFAQTLTFARRFMPLESAAAVTETSLAAAVAIAGRGWRFELRERGGEVIAEVADGAPAALARRISDFLGADDDLAPFYAAAEGDAAMRPVVRALHGLHHLRFLGLEEIAVYCVMMQRTPMTAASRLKQRFLDRFGLPAGELRAMPELAELARIPADAIADAIGHRAKGERIATVVGAVATLGEDFLRTAPYERARDALLAIPGIGPFSAGAILLRGLGRSEALPGLAMFEDAGRAIYGAGWNEAEIAKRYGRELGTWAFYLKTAAARVSDSRTPSGSASSRRSGAAAGRTGPRRSRDSSRDRRPSPTSSRGA